MLFKQGVLAHNHLMKYAKNGKIHVSPFNPDFVGTNSIDVTLGNKLKILMLNAHDHIEPTMEQKYYEIDIPESGLILDPSLCYLGHTVEEIGSDYFLPCYEGRSSIARMFLHTHVCAGFGDLGFKRQWTLEIYCQKRIKVYPGMKIGQVYFTTVTDRSVLYGRDIKAHYANQAGAQESLYGEKV